MGCDLEGVALWQWRKHIQMQAVTKMLTGSLGIGKNNQRNVLEYFFFPCLPEHFLVLFS